MCYSLKGFFHIYVCGESRPGVETVNLYKKCFLNWMTVSTLTNPLKIKRFRQKSIYVVEMRRL
jgi:hypothetical protein